MKFKLAHISDLHLGYASGKKKLNEDGMNVRENDGYIAFEKLVDGMIEQKVDAVLVAGDMFHSPRPKNHTIVIAQEQLRRLAKEGIVVYIIAGNHDATDVRAEIPSSRLLHEPANNIFSYSDPYVVKEIAEGIFMHFLGHHAYVDQQDTFKKIELKNDCINILASHGSCFDSNIGVMLKSPNEPREVVIPQEVMDLEWDYTLLGHIHERGWIGSSDRKTDTQGRKQFYNGSLLRRGFSDKVSPNGRGWTLWTIDTESKSIEPTMYTVEERIQLDMKPIEVKDKSTLEIEKEIIEQLKAIDESIIKKYGEINLSNTPIVRQTITGVSTVARLSLNLQRFNEFTSKYLTHIFRIVPDNEILSTDGTIDAETLNNGDIVAVFSEWNKKNEKKFKAEDEDVQKRSFEAATEYLKQSRDELLTKED